MARCTLRGNMRTSQREAGLSVVECSWLPRGWAVALRAVWAKAAFVRIIFLVAANTVCWRALEGLVLMTGCAGSLLVSANQFE